ncbi:Serine/threonine protein kinase [Taxawa tesnikishii (nom. ined.)]|nr:Serine/threonine protein kinase [Dothideales sp. JES 119]
MSVDQPQPTHGPVNLQDPSNDPSFAELDKALQSVRYSLDVAAQGASTPGKQVQKASSNPMLKRHHSLPYGSEGQAAPGAGSVSSRTRRSVRQSAHPAQRYETPDEEDELLDEALMSAHRAARRLDRASQVVKSKENLRPPMPHVTSDPGFVPYLTPSPSKENNIVNFGENDVSPSKPVDIASRPQKDTLNPQWPTPPYEENEWAASAAASIFAAASQAQATYR